MTSRPLFAPALLATALIMAASVMSGCGESSEAQAEAGSKVTVAAADSLQQAMDSAARSIDGVRGTRSSLDRLGASLQASIDQTGDVIAVLTPRASAPTERLLLDGARSQRSFLQAAKQATASRSRSTGLGAVARARDAGRAASNNYGSAGRAAQQISGRLPSSTTFNTGRLRDAVQNANKKRPQKQPGTSSGSSAAPAASGTSCGSGISANSVTSCPFALNVASEYSASGGASSIDVHSPVTGEIYSMSCQGSMPVTCSGGNGAVVTIR